MVQISRIRMFFKHLHLWRAMPVLLLVVLLAACGMNSGTTTGSNGTGAGAGTTPSPTAPLTVQKCGAVHAMRMQVVPNNKEQVKAVEDCFLQAYQQCHPATMTFSQASLDTGVIHTFTVKNDSGKCTITDTVGRYIAPHPPTSTTNYTCTGLVQSTDGLHVLACGSMGNVLVPTK